nr:MAG: replication associated protein [Cressdnaviricota sp.]
MTESQVISKGFRFQNQRALFTYRTHLQKDGLKGFFGALGAKTVEVAHETGDPEVPYEHSHVCVEWPKAYQTRNERKFDYHGEHPNIRFLRTPADFSRALNYLSKEDPECEGLGEGTGKSLVETIWEAPTLGDALKTCTSHSQIIPTIAAWNVKPTPMDRLEPQEHWYDYQVKVFKLLTSPKQERKVHWFYETVGNLGKTYTGKWCSQEHGSLVVDCFGGTANLATIIQNALQGGWKAESLIFDFPRRAQQHEISEGMECCCNGRVTVTKYSSKVITFKPPRLIVFANFPPQWDSMSADRWDAWEINPDGTVEPRGPRSGQAAGL